MTKNNEMSGKIVRVAKMAAVLAAGLILTACGSDGLPGLPGLSACETNDTAEINFTNTAGGTATLHFVIDGTNVTGDVADGATSGPHTVSSGTHTVGFHRTNETLACINNTSTYTQCSTTGWSCGG